jgi:GT2 family glycosyltransferase
MKRISDNFDLFFRMLSSIIQSPKRFWKAFEWEKVKTLFSALRREPPAHIFHNFQKLLQSQQLGHPPTPDEKKDIFGFIDIAQLNPAQQLIDIHGWTLAREGISKMEVYLDDQYLGTIHQGVDRPDVLETFPLFDNNLRPGFHFTKKIKKQGDLIRLIVFDKKKNREVLWRELTKNGTLPNINQQYQVFLEKQNDREIDLREIEKTIDSFEYSPLISVVTPVYNVPPIYLEKCVQSLLGQWYPNWELCLYDDASTSTQTIHCLEEWGKKDQRIKVRFGSENQHISGASNEAINMAQGDFIGLLDNDDELTPDALFEVIKVLNKNPRLDFIYSDEDKLETDGTRSEPHFKPDYSPDLLLSTNYICHFSVIRKSLGDAIGWFRKGYEGSQDYDLFLRITEQKPLIHHIPKVLYHWRKIPGSTAARYDEKSFADQAALASLSDYVERNKLDARVEKGLFPGSFRIKRNILLPELVSIIIPFKDKPELLNTCVNSILSKTEYPEYEILLVNNNSEEPATLNLISQLCQAHSNIHHLSFEGPFNFSKINNWAVRQSKGKHVLLLNNDTEAIQNGWLTAMMEHIQRPEVGAVGAKLLYPDKTVQHAGVILKINGVAAHSHKHYPSESPGYFSRLNMIQNLSACTAACLLITKDVYKEVGGMDEENLKIAFNDVDLCIKIRQKGYLIVYTPFAELFHHESKSRGMDTVPEKRKRFEQEIKFFQTKWRNILEQGDPYYNPNLTLTAEDFSLDV